MRLFGIGRKSGALLHSEHHIGTYHSLEIFKGTDDGAIFPRLLAGIVGGVASEKS